MAAYEDKENVPEKRRIHYAPEDAGEVRDAVSEAPPLNRQDSNMSVHSGGIQRRRSIDPALALPIEYRTLSFHIDENNKGELAKARKAKNESAAELADLDWHTITQGELFQRLNTSAAQGLVRCSPETRCRVLISWEPLGEPAPAVASLALAIVLFAVFVIQAAFNAWQDFSSSRVMASITTMLPENCVLIRNRTLTSTMAVDVVPGDILTIKAGNKLPADVRLIEVSSDAKLDRSILTGESMPIAGTTDSTDNNYLETRCIGMQGTHCISGSGKGVVVAIGDLTVFGRIAKLTSAPNNARTTLQKEILRFVLIIVSRMFFFIVLVVFIWAAYLRPNYPGYIDVSQLIVSLVSVGIAFITEGLPIAFTMSLTIVAKIMKQNNVLCKSLKTVETLGAVSVICSDKTGTLTKNEMTATDCTISTRKMTMEDAQIEITRASKTYSSVNQLRAVAALCNAGEFDASTMGTPLKERVIQGDATDQAILRFSEGLGPV